MADSKSKKIDETVQTVATVTTTEETPANADKTSNPVDNDAKSNQPPVRTNAPNVPIAQTLAAGAGAHEPPDDPHIGADGRWYADTDDAKATREAGRLDETAK